MNLMQKLFNIRRNRKQGRIKLVNLSLIFVLPSQLKSMIYWARKLFFCPTTVEYRSNRPATRNTRFKGQIH